MLANKHRRHLVSNRLALATGFILLLAQTGQFTPDEIQDGAHDANTIITTETKADAKKHYYNVLLDLGLLLLAR